MRDRVTATSTGLVKYKTIEIGLTRFQDRFGYDMSVLDGPGSCVRRYVYT